MTISEQIYRAITPGKKAVVRRLLNEKLSKVEAKGKDPKLALAAYKANAMRIFEAEEPVDASTPEVKEMLFDWLDGNNFTDARIRRLRVYAPEKLPTALR